MRRFSYSSIQTQLIILIVIMSALPLGVIINSAVNQRNKDLHDAGLIATRLVHEVENEQNALLAGAEQLFTVLSQIPAVKKHDSKEVSKLLADIVTRSPQYANLLIADNSGLLWASAIPSKDPISISYADRRYFKAAIASGKFSSGEYGVSRTLNKPVMNYGYPIKDANGKITDVAIVAFTLEKYGQLLRGRTVPNNTSLLLTDHKGTVLFVPTAPELVGQQDRDDLFRRMTTGDEEGTFESMSNIGVRRAFAYLKLRLEGEQTPYMYVRTGVAVDPLLAKSRNALLLNVGLMSTILLFSLLIALYISKRGILDKIHLLQGAAKNIADGNLDIRVSESVSGGELGDLGHAFDEMATKLTDDIEKLREADKALREREGRLSVIFDTSQAGIILVDSQGNIIFANRRMSEMFGYLPNELIGISYPQLVHPDEKFLGENRMHKLIAGEIDHVYNERLYLKKDGSNFWGYLSGRRHEDASGNLISLVGVIVDISEIKESQELLKASEERYRSIIELAADSILLGNPEGNIIDANHSVIELTGFTHEELIGMNISKIFSKEELQAVPFRYDLLQEGKTVRSERSLTTKDGITVPIEMNTKMMPDGCYQTFIRDMSEQRRQQDELLKVQKLQSLGVLAGGIAHDFNNILTGVMGNISFARVSLEKTNEAYDPLIRAEKATQRAANLARQLLLFAKGGEPVKKVFSIRAVIMETLDLVLSGTNVKERIDFPDDLYAIDADEGQISQAFHNVVINAVQAMPNGGQLTINGKNVVLNGMNEYNLANGIYVEVLIKDEGYGISEANLKNIFDPYFTTKQMGTGLGLATTYSIITTHGGRISVQSAIGEGAMFTILLPATDQDFNKASKSDEAELERPSTGSVLVMDDEEMIRELATLILGRQGYLVITCSNGKEAISLYKSALEASAPFSIVLMDLTIPGNMGGVETAKHILEIDPNAHLVVSSGFSADPVMANYKEYGFCAAIEKPYNIEDISRIIGSCNK